MKTAQIIVLVVALSVIASAVLIQYNKIPDETEPPSIRITPESYDFGSIPREVVRKTFVVENTGGSLLEITSVSTSCGCTSAKIESEQIKPGESARLLVEMDPNVMGNITGRVDRTIYVKSNDPENEEVEAYITADIFG